MSNNSRIESVKLNIKGHDVEFSNIELLGLKSIIDGLLGCGKISWYDYMTNPSAEAIEEAERVVKAHGTMSQA